ALATYLERAGELQRVTALLEPTVPALPAGPVRARGWPLLAEGAGPRTIAELERHLDPALAEHGIEADTRAYAPAQQASPAAAPCWRPGAAMRTTRSGGPSTRSRARRRPAHAGTGWRRRGRAASRRCSPASPRGPRAACAPSGSTPSARASTSPASSRPRPT